MTLSVFKHYIICSYNWPVNNFIWKTHTLFFAYFQVLIIGPFFKLFNSVSILLQASSRLLLLVNRVMSSAYTFLISDSFRSLIITLNRIGLISDPWGTPLCILPLSDVRFPVFIWNVLFSNKLFNSFRVFLWFLALWFLFLDWLYSFFFSYESFIFVVVCCVECSNGFSIRSDTY